MPALKPLPSVARLTANRANAQKSTGPKTEAGKARSRGNAVRHGLTGVGIALPIEAEAEVGAQFAAITAELAPTTVQGGFFARRVALAMVRAERAARHEAKALAHRVRHAVEAFDHTRAAEAESALGRLRVGNDVPLAWRDLTRTPEGIARLAAELHGLRGCLSLPEPLWTQAHGVRLDACQGVAPDPLIPSRAGALSATLLGSFDLLTRRDHAAIAEAGVDEPTFAHRALVDLIDRELVALRDRLESFDHEAIAQDRAEAAERAVFDPSPAATLARRYEASAVREVRHALALFHHAEAEIEAEGPIDHVAGDEASAEAGETPAAIVVAEPIDESATIAVKLLRGQEVAAPLASIGAGQDGGFDSGFEGGGWADPGLTSGRKLAAVGAGGMASLV